MMRTRSRAESRPAADALGERHEIADAEGGFQLRERAEREHELARRAADLGLDLAAVMVRHGFPPHAAANVSAPADSSASS